VDLKFFFKSISALCQVEKKMAEDLLSVSLVAESES
jgi:hypothetical protein